MTREQRAVLIRERLAARPKLSGPIPGPRKRAYRYVPRVGKSSAMYWLGAAIADPAPVQWVKEPDKAKTAPKPHLPTTRKTKRSALSKISERLLKPEWWRMT